MVQPPALREGKQAMVNPKEVNCEQVWPEVSNYLEGEVDPALRAAMDAHFLTCASCKSVLEGTRNVIRLYGDERLMDERTIDVPAGFGRRLEKRLAQNARASGGRWSTLSAWLVPLAALVLIAGGLRLAQSLTIGRPLQSPMAERGHGIPPDMQVVVTSNAKVFHVAGCPFIHNKKTERTLTAKEAIQEGYVPCLRCMRKYLEAASAGHTAQGSDVDADSDADDDDAHGGGQ